MDQKLNFEVTRQGAANCYAIRLLDRAQMAALALAEGCAKSVVTEAILVAYDEGGGEIAPVEGYDDSTARGRLVLKVLDEVYCEALNRIIGMTEGAVNPPSGEIFVFRGADVLDSRPRRAGT